MPSTLSKIPGVTVGNAESGSGRSGVTVVRFDPPALTVVDVRGGASGTFDTASLALDATFGRRLALFLAGGSLYGLDAARGVRRALQRDGKGVRVFENPNPVLPISGAILFDLPRHRGGIPDYERLGYRAARSASRQAIPPGRHGAGAGATVGKYLGRGRAVPGGIGSAATVLPGLGWVGALVAVNAVGAVRDPSNGRWRAGPLDRNDTIVPPAVGGRGGEARGTTLAVVVVEARLDRTGLQRIAVRSHDALARWIVPCHTATDGDVVFVASTSRRRVPGDPFPGATVDRLGALAEEVIGRSIVAAIDPATVRRREQPSEGGSREGRGSGRSS